MKQIEAIIERAPDGTFSVWCVKEIFTGIGATVEEAKADMAKQMSFYRQTAIEEGFDYPGFLDEEYTIDYRIDSSAR